MAEIGFIDKNMIEDLALKAAILNKKIGKKCSKEVLLLALWHVVYLTWSGANAVNR